MSLHIGDVIHLTYIFMLRRFSLRFSVVFDFAYVILPFKCFQNFLCGPNYLPFFFASGFWILFRKCFPMQRLSGIQLWFLLVCVWFNSFNISPWSNWNLLLCDLKYRCIFVCFCIADHLFQKNLLVCFSPSGLRCYFYDTLNFHMYVGLFLGFL